MIKYKLTCKECNIFFDSWFASSNEFEKTLMAPKLMNRSYLKSSEEKNVKLREVKNKIREYQKFIKENFDYVGDNFAYEARSIHYNQKKKNKGIYGTASKKEITELKEEGVEAELIPWVEDKSN